MGENSKISWCHHTANFWIGCTEVSAECDNCYARTLAGRYGWAEWGNDKERHQTKITLGKLQSWSSKAQAAGETHRVFVNSLSDICDKFAPQEWRNRIVDWGLPCGFLNFLLLTKRPQNYNEMFPCPPSNFWGGTTVGVRKSLTRINHLRKTNFRIKFLSIEPLLEDLGDLDLTGIDWVILGGESGTQARPCNLEWMRNIIRQAREQGSAVFVKQLGKGRVEYGKVHIQPVGGHGQQAGSWTYKDSHGTDIAEFPDYLQFREFPTEAKL